MNLVLAMFLPLVLLAELALGAMFLTEAQGANGLAAVGCFFLGVVFVVLWTTTTVALAVVFERAASVQHIDREVAGRTT